MHCVASTELWGTLFNYIRGVKNKVSTTVCTNWLGDGDSCWGVQGLKLLESLPRFGSVLSTLIHPSASICLSIFPSPPFFAAFTSPSSFVAFPSQDCSLCYRPHSAQVLCMETFPVRNAPECTWFSRYFTHNTYILHYTNKAHLTICIILAVCKILLFAQISTMFGSASASRGILLVVSCSYIIQH